MGSLVRVLATVMIAAVLTVTPYYVSDGAFGANILAGTAEFAAAAGATPDLSSAAPAPAPAPCDNPGACGSLRGAITTTSTSVTTSSTTSSSSTSVSLSTESTSTTLAIPICGNADSNDAVTATDALLSLLAAVGAGVCADCFCDVNSAGGVTATDSLLILQFAVGQPVALNCPLCAF